MTAPPLYRWLLIGDFTEPRLDSVLEWINCHIATSVSSLAEAVDTVTNSPHEFEFVLVYQGIPDEYASADIDRLIGKLPLARWIICLGEWCDSIGRTEQHWPIGWCVPLRDAIPRLAAEMNAASIGRPPLPPTASRDEAFAFHASQLQSKCENSHSVFVTGDDPEVVATLKDLLAVNGFRKCESAACNDLNILAVTMPDGDTLSQVTKFRAEHPHCRILVATDLVTYDQATELRTAGANAVVSQLRFAEAASWEADFAS